MPVRALVQNAPALRLVPAYAMGSLAVAWLVERVRAFWTLPV
jgi:hypothetical protein